MKLKFVMTAGILVFVCAAAAAQLNLAAATSGCNTVVSGPVSISGKVTLKLPVSSPVRVWVEAYSKQTRILGCGEANDSGDYVIWLPAGRSSYVVTPKSDARLSWQPKNRKVNTGESVTGADFTGTSR